MDAQTLNRVLLGAVGVQGLLVAAVAVILTVHSTSAIIPLLTLVLVCSLMSATLLRRFAEPIRQMPTSLALMTWGFSRFTLFVASLTLVTCWLVSLALGLDARSLFFGAAVLVLLLMGIIGIIGRALLIAVRAVRRWRLREGE